MLAKDFCFLKVLIALRFVVYLAVFTGMKTYNFCQLENPSVAGVA